MLPVLDLRVDPNAFDRFLARAEEDVTDARASVRTIVAAVRTEGDAAVRRYTLAFDGLTIDSLQVNPDDLPQAFEQQPPEIQSALELAADRIRAYHTGQRPSEHTTTDDGITVTDRVIPVARAGCYAPGGRATYPSTVLMTAIPAAVAGVTQRIVCIPPGPDGRVASAALAAAHVAGVDAVYRIGGAQAIAAMAFGTETVPATDVIVGPGNLYVSLAKELVSGTVHVESMAGPSEIAIVTDDPSDAHLVALDLCAQAEHGPAGTTVVFTWNDEVVEAVRAAVIAAVAEAGRADVIRDSLATGGCIVRVPDADAARVAVDAMAPEHLEVLCSDGRTFADAVHNAGAIFVGRNAPAALGDYVVGTNHVLPTGRAARYASALRVADFLKFTHVVEVDQSGLAALGPTAIALAELEGLVAHADSVRARLESNTP